MYKEFGGRPPQLILGAPAPQAFRLGIAVPPPARGILGAAAPNQGLRGGGSTPE